jgi:hypothetical protein
VKETPLKKLAQINRLHNAYRREAQEMWQLASPYRQGVYIRRRLKGATPETAIKAARP